MINFNLRKTCKLSDRFSESEIERSSGLFWTNAFAYSGASSDSPSKTEKKLIGGQTVFPTFSFASHSCISNSNHVVFPNRHLALQAKILIKKGQELTISYISPIQVRKLNSIPKSSILNPISLCPLDMLPFTLVS